MRISDWSSDVCSSDLKPRAPEVGTRDRRASAWTPSGTGITAMSDASPSPEQEITGSLQQRGTASKEATTSLYNEMDRSEEHTSELQSLMRISYAVFCLKNKHEKTETTQIKQEHIISH